jgi:Putative prokaryotic signal transducing protein
VCYSRPGSERAATLIGKGEWYSLAMARKFEPQIEWQRLYEQYQAMSDEELLGLAASLDDLTDVAQEVLGDELRRRRLQPKSVAAARDATAERARTPGTVVLMTSSDAIAAGEACGYLEDEGIELEVRDVAEQQTGMRSFAGLPPVALELIVPHADRNRAMTILREKMGLFPLQEVAIADEPEDDGTVSGLGDFGRRDQAEEVGQILADFGIWYRIVANPDGTEEAEDCYRLEVREIDLLRAGEVVEKKLNLPEY